MKHILIISFLHSIVFASQSYEITPIGDTQLRYESKSKTHSLLGKSLLKQNTINHNDYVLGGTFGIKALFNHYEFKSSLYGVARVNKKDANLLKIEKTFYDNNQDQFLYLGEFNINKRINNHSFTLGRQTYKNNLVDENYRITKNSYEGLKYTYKNKSINIESLYFNKIASSTIANSVPHNHKYGFLGYGMGYNTGGFQDISKHIINKDLSTNGAIHLITKLTQKSYNIALENLYVDNFFNTSNIILGTNMDNLYLKTSFIYQTSVGDNYIEKYIQNSEQGKKLKSKHFQLDFNYKKDKLKLSYLLSYTPKNDNSIYKGTLFSPFSNSAAWIRGLNSSHASIADTISQKISFSDLYYLDKLPLSFSTAFIKYDIGKNNGLTPNPLKTEEFYIHTKSYFSKNLSLTIQFSKVKNYDPLTLKTKNSKLVLDYKF